MTGDPTVHPVRPTRRPARWGAAAGSVGLVAVLLVGTGVVAWRGPGGPGEGAAAAEPESAGEFGAAVCGVADPDRYAALAADAPVARVDTVVADLGDQVPSALAAAGPYLAALSDGAVTRWTEDGDPLDQARVGDAGSFALTSDGTVLAATGPGTVGGWPLDAAEPGTEWDLSGLDRGEVAAVIGWSAGTGAWAAVAFTGSPELALLRPDGEVDPDGPRIEVGWYPRFFPLDDGGLVVMSDADEQSSSITLTRYAADGSPGLSITGPLTTGSTNGRAAALDHPTGVVTAPDGGLLIAGPTWRLLEVGPDGVWRRIALSGQGQGSAFTFADLTPMVRDRSGTLYVSATEDGLSLSRVAADQLDLLLDAPVTWDLNHAATMDSLGFGLGLSTTAIDDYVPAGQDPVVTFDVDPAWGRLSGDYLLRYRVTGDPSQPVSPTTGTLDLPPGGGSVPLELPAAAPGAYEVHAELVEAGTGTVRTATCLRYAVGAPGATLDPAGLADGADWGGAGPLRGVQLAAELGIGSHRVQLDVGALVADPESAASAAGLDLSALPGAEEDDPAAGLSAAAALAARTGVQLYVQVGQGGEAEHAAVAAGTWGDWVRVIVQELRRAAPELHLWAPWNEPNNTGFGDGGDYVRQVLTPFAAGVRAADPDGRVIGGNALNVVVGWYRQLIDAGGCAQLDVIGIHPYTGFNRSWQEEGADGPLGQITALREALAADPTCARTEIWDTESGWWSDGPANHWQQAQDLARTRLLMTTLGVTEWTYFFSEGGWGEGGFSWSLIQVGSFVKPGALAMATVDTVLAGRAGPTVVDTGDGAVTALAFPAATGAASTARQPGPDPRRDQPVLAVWAADASTTLTLTADHPTTVTVTDLYGGTRTLTTDQAGVPFPVTGAPQYLTADAALSVTAERPLLPGTNLLAGGTVTASSGGDPAVLVTAAGAEGSPWQAGARTADGPDATPWVRVDLDRPTELSRVTVTSAGIRCCTAGVRSYTVEVLGTGKQWQEVGAVTGAFGDRTTAVDFEPMTATAIRVRVPAITSRGVRIPDLNYSGQYGGLLPAWEPVATEPTWPLSLQRLSAS